MKEYPIQLRKYRKLRGMTQEDLAKQMGLVCKNRISLWENGKTQPSLKNIKKLKEIFGILVLELF